MPDATPPEAKNDKENEPANGRPPLRKRHVLLAMLIVGVLLGGLYGIHLYHTIMSYESTDDAFLEGHVVPISPRVAGTVARVLIDDNRSVTTGSLLVQLDPTDFQTTVAENEAALAAARAQERQARTQIDLTSITANAGMTQATYGLEFGHSGISTAQAQSAAAASQVGQAQANLKAAEASLQEEQAKVVQQQAIADRANADWKRYEQLYKDGVASAEQRDLFQSNARQAIAALEAERKKEGTTRAQVEQARAAVAAAQEAQRAAQSQVGQAQAARGQASGRLEEANVTPQRIAASRSALEGASAEAKRLEAVTAQARLNLSYTRILAPVAGRITRKQVEPGMYVQVSQPLFSIVPRELWVNANFKETQLTAMRPGQPVTIRVDAYPGRDFSGHIDSIQRGTGARFSLFPPENATGNYIKVVQRVPVKIVFDALPPDAPLLAPGMSVVPKVKVK